MRMRIYAFFVMDITALRKERSLSQTELAALLGVDQSTVSRLEMGKLTADARTLLALEAIAAKIPPQSSAA